MDIIEQGLTRLALQILDPLREEEVGQIISRESEEIKKRLVKDFSLIMSDGTGRKEEFKERLNDYFGLEDLAGEYHEDHT